MSPKSETKRRTHEKSYKFSREYRATDAWPYFSAIFHFDITRSTKNYTAMYKSQSPSTETQSKRRKKAVKTDSKPGARLRKKGQAQRFMQVKRDSEHSQKEKR